MNTQSFKLVVSAAVGAAVLGGLTPAHAQVDNAVATVSGCTTEERDINADCRRAPAPGANLSPQAAAPIDLTGYWTAVISEDWRWRMLTPPKGDFASLPLNAAAIKVGNEWNPAEDGSCKAFGAPALMRNPLRVRFEWTDDKTLQATTDHGQQTRTFHFGAAPAASGPSLQGTSAAFWDQSGLRVNTTNLAPGYLRKNGVPYSAQARVTEYYDTYSAFDQEWMTITTIVEDPVYLTREFITSLDFKKLPDGSSWKPTPCKAT